MTVRVIRYKILKQFKKDVIQYRQRNCIFLIAMWFNHYSYLPKAFANPFPVIICLMIARRTKAEAKP